MAASLTERIKFYQSVFGRGELSRDEKNFSVKCPICDPKDSSKKKLVIRTVDDVTHCWVCGFSSRSLIPLLRKFAGQSALSEYVSKFSSEKRERFDDVEQEKKLELPKDIRLLACLNDSDPDALALLKYLRSRDVSDRDLWRYRICYSHEPLWYRRVIFVSHDANGDPNYITSRSIDPKKKPKYFNCDVDKNSIVFGEVNIDWSKSVTLCEGPFDMLRCGENAVPLLGSELSENSAVFDRIVTNSTPVVVALDADTAAGKRPRLVKKLQEYDIDVRVADLGGYPDPGSAPAEHMKKMIEQARHVGWLDSFMQKLQFATGSR